MIRIIKRQAENEEIKIIRKIEKDVWIDVEEPKEKEIEFLEKRIGISKDVVLDYLDEDEIPRVSSENGFVSIIVRVPIEERNKIYTIPLGIVITNNFILTIHSKHIDFLDQFFEGREKFSTRKRIRLLFQLLSIMIQRYTKILRNIEKEIRETEKRFLRKVKNDDIMILMDMKETVLDLQNAIYENNRVLESLLTGHHIKLYKGDIRIINDIIIDNKQCVTMSSFLIKNVNNALEMFEWIVSNNMNDLMKKLTSVAVILSIPVLISGLYGMNVNLPIQKHPHAFWILTLLSLLLSFIAFLYFKKKDWI